MIGLLEKHFVSRNRYEHRIGDLYHALAKHVETIAGLQHQIDQLSAAVIELRKDKLVVRDGQLQRWMPDYGPSASNGQRVTYVVASQEVKP